MGDEKGFDVEIEPGKIVHVDSFRIAPSRIFLDGKEVTGRLEIRVKGAPSFDINPEDAINPEVDDDA